MNLRQAVNLMKQAKELFPFTEYTDPQMVKSLQRRWFKAVSYMRSAEPSKWLIDKKVERCDA